jgi:transcriptional regulator with GAF, ATPase, and Fis domain
MVEALSTNLGPDAPDALRAKERAHLLALLEREHGTTVLLRGPRGIGKEQLADAIVEAVKARPRALTLEGRVPSAGGRSFHSFAEIVRAAMGWAEHAGVSSTLVDPLLDDLAPALDLGPEWRDSPSLDAKLRFFEAVKRLLAMIAERTRLLVVVRDLERADGDTLELAAYLADNLFGDPALDAQSAPPGLLLLLCRDDRHVPQRARDFLAEADERRSIQRLELRGLDYDGLRQYLQSPRVLEKVMQASEGIPREIDELFDALPSNVEQLFERRLDAMSPTERRVLRALALSERPSAARVLAQVTGLPLRDVAQALAAHREARVLERRIQHGELEFHFARTSNLEVTQRTTPADERAQLHGGWAQAIGAQSGGAELSLLAFHHLRSSEPVRGVPLAIRAAESHAVAGAFDAAASQLEDALPHARGELRTTILARLSELGSLRGKHREAVRYCELWKLELHEAERAKALVREAELHNAVGDHERAWDVASAARGALDRGAVAEHVAAFTVEADALYQLGRLDQAGEAARAGLELVDAGDRDVPAKARVELVNLLGKIALQRDDARGARAHFEATLDASVRLGLPREEARALVNLGLAEMRAGRHTESERALRAAVEKAQAASDLQHLAFGSLNLGVIAHLRGALGQAIEHYRASRGLFQRLANKTQLTRVLINLGNLYVTAGDIRRARAHVDEALRLARTTGAERMLASALVLEGDVLFEEGDRRASEQKLREAMVHQRRLGAERPLDTMLDLATQHLRADDIDAADATLTEIEAQLGAAPARRISLRARLLRGRIGAQRGQSAAVDALAALRDEVQQLGEQLLVRDLELAMGLALVARGQREGGRLHLMTAKSLQEAVAAELPAELRASFLALDLQRQVVDALERLERPERPTAPPVERATLEARAPSFTEPTPSEPSPAARGSIPPPATRSSDWEKKYAALIGSSPKLFRVFHILDRVAASESTVLILGESGTGKELVAEAIHKGSPRQRGPFVKLNCAALVETLLLSELFGHERGSFTGAHQRKAGRFEMAAGGTIFLDEIGDISPKTQVALLRVLQEREFERVGGGRAIRLEARVVCATNKNLAQMVRDGTFREDLYYRLKGLTLELPPLRERPEDIEALAAGFLERYAQENGTPVKALDRDAAVMLRRYSWPGNVRELENVIRSVALFADGTSIGRADFDEYRELFEDVPAFDRAHETSAVERPSELRPSEFDTPRVDARPSFTPAPMAPEVRGRAPMRELTPVPDAPHPAAAPQPFAPGADAFGDGAPSAPREGTLLSPIFSEGVPLAELKKKIQADAIARALRMSKGNITRAAEILGMKRPRLSQIINANEELKALCHGGSAR